MELSSILSIQYMERLLTLASLRSILDMSEDTTIPKFSLLGGPLYRIGCRLGLVIRGINTIPLGLVLAAFASGVLMALAVIEGVGEKIFSLAAISVHARLLIAIPLFFLCELLVNPRMAVFVRLFIDSGIVSDSDLPELESLVTRIHSLKDSWLPETICLLASVLMFRLPIISHGLSSYGMMPDPEMTHSIGAMTLTAKWYWLVCLPLYRFLLLRWLWRLSLWIYFLWRLSRMRLHLMPTHPDGAGGLGYLEIVHQSFIPLVLASSAVLSASFAEGISRGAITFEKIYPAVGFSFILFAALYLGPLFIFSRQLRTCKFTGWNVYTRLGAQYVKDFENKWINNGQGAKEPLLGTPDIQSLADLNNSFGIVKNMRIAAISKPLVVRLAVAALLPFLPLLLFIYPVKDLAQILFKMVLGA